MKRIVYTRPDGGMSVVVPTGAFIEKFSSEEEAMVAVQDRSVPPEATDVRLVEESEIPADRTFRNAWENKNGSCAVNMNRARTIATEHIRKTGGTVDAQAIASCRTPEELRALWPSAKP